MILIPQRLFKDRQVTTLIRDGNECVLRKNMQEPVLNREGYISNHVVSILLNGEQHIRTYEEELIKVRKNEVLFIPRGMYNITDLIPENGSFESLLFFFDDRAIHEFLAHVQVESFTKRTPPTHIKLGIVPGMKVFADSVIRLYGEHSLKNRHLLSLKIQELFHLLSGEVKSREFAHFLFNLTLPKKRQLKSFMERNYNKPLKVEDYAYLTGRSLSSFRRDFKSFYNVTPQQWLKDKRIEKALQHLLKDEMTVTETAFEVGYGNVSYFIRVFKEKTGLSPKQYVLERLQGNNSA